MQAVILDVKKPIVVQAPYLWGSLLDGLLLGGASVLAFIVFRVINMSGETILVLGVAMQALAHFVNHPHFAHSYQIFYGGWSDIRSGQMCPTAVWRWWWAAVVAPVSLAAFLCFAGWRAMQGNTLWIAVAINLMGGLVGWHYVKQGFGMAMTDAALKRNFWPDRVRQALLVNAYACWAAAWIGLNSTKAATAFWGFFSLQVELPILLPWVAATVCLGTTIWATVAVVRAIELKRSQQPDRLVPYNGLLAYGVTLYLWTVFAWADPSFMLVIPFFHSLQYLVVVWRYKINEWGLGCVGALKCRRIAAFGLSGIVLGGLGFWMVPLAIDFGRTGQWTINSSSQQPALALACAWLFINVHHYLIDNVFWRKGNPKVRKYLFGFDPLK